MTLDPYGYSPCGTPKKIKFYCPEMIPDLEKIERMLQGEQRVACLEHVQKLAEKYPDHSIPLYYFAVLQLQIGNEDTARAAINTFVEKHPDNPAAHALNASMLGSTGSVEDAINELQLAIELSPQQLHMAVYEGISAVAQMLLMSGKVIAARAHLMFQANISPPEDNRAIQLLMRINSSPELPVLLKQDPTLAECPDDYKHKEEFEAALDDAAQGRWRKAMLAFEELRTDAPRNSAILENLAVMYSSLGQNEKAISCLKSYAAAGERSDFEAATEALALAQLLNDQDADMCDVVILTYTVSDIEALIEKLRLEKRAEVLPLDLSKMTEDETPPPKVAYWILDREVPESADGITIDNAPNVLGELFVFGKETDREARLEFSANRSDEFDTVKRQLKEVCGDLISDDCEEVVQGQIPNVQAALTWSWRLPDSMTAEQRSALVDEKREQVLLEKWTNLSLSELDGKSPKEVFGDSSKRAALGAALLILEISGQQQRWNFDYNRLRELLKLPVLESISSEDTDVMQLPVNRLYRLNAENLSDEELLTSYGRASIRGLNVSLKVFATEMLKRESVVNQVDKAELYGQLAKSADDSDSAIEYLRQAQTASVAEGKSPAIWKLAELSIQIEKRDAETAQAMINDIIEKHVREPGIAEAFSQIMYRAGLIGPDGQPTGAMPGAPPAEAAPAAQASPDGGLWTPDGSSSGAAPEEKKSKLWVPGMD
ncbi:MAG: hypothetical protein COA78_14385 [Blastopirellula sp.]|nr:MAG: hypothetical protein COA78_14385 [Blastopirellula sp.]